MLLDQNKQPISLQQGWITSLSDLDWPTVEFFTNRTGRFVATNLISGLYCLHLPETNGEFLEFEIPAQQEGIFNIGTLELL